MTKETRDQSESGKYRTILSNTGLDIRRFTFIAGDFGVSWDVAANRILAEGPKDDHPLDEGWHPSMFQLIGVCSHCEAIHRPIFVWHGSYGLFIAEDGGLDLGDMPRYPGSP